MLAKFTKQFRCTIYYLSFHLLSGASEQLFHSKPVTVSIVYSFKQI